MAGRIFNFTMGLILVGAIALMITSANKNAYNAYNALKNGKTIVCGANEVSFSANEKGTEFGTGLVITYGEHEGMLSKNVVLKMANLETCHVQ